MNSCGVSAEQVEQGGMVAFIEIHHVDVLAYAGAIGGGPVSVAHLELWFASDGYLTHKREEIVGYAQVFYPMLSDGWAPTGLK